MGCEFLLTALDRLKPAVRARIFFANLAALLIAFAYAAFESGSMQFVAREVYSAFPRLYRNIEGHVTVVDGIVTLISETNINRRVGLMTLLIWPTALMLAGLAAARWRRAGWVVLALLSSIMIWASGHQSSQLAIIAGVGAFGLALRWPVAARRVVAIAWVAVVLLIVPICTLAFKASLQEASWLPLSARHRVVIWAYTANEVAKAPVLGIGADATQSLFKEQMMRQGERKQVDGFDLVTTATPKRLSADLVTSRLRGRRTVYDRGSRELIRDRRPSGGRSAIRCGPNSPPSPASSRRVTVFGRCGSRPRSLWAPSRCWLPLAIVRTGRFGPATCRA